MNLLVSGQGGVGSAQCKAISRSKDLPLAHQTTQGVGGLLHNTDSAGLGETKTIFGHKQPL